MLLGFYVGQTCNTLYLRYSPSDRAAIGKYASQHGVAAASRFFSKKFDTTLSKTTVSSIKTAYIQGVREKRRADNDGEVTSLPCKKRGRTLLLGDDLDMKVQMYLKKVRSEGGVMTARIAMAMARGILLSCDKTKLEEFGGHVHLNRHWAYSLLTRMKFVK